MHIHLSGLPAFTDAVTAPLGAIGLRVTPHLGRAGLVLRSRNGSQGPNLTPEDLDDVPRLDVTFGEIGGRHQARIGPFSVPGRTSCPGCVAAHERENGELRRLEVAAGPSPALLWAAVGLAVRELDVGVRYLRDPESVLPHTWSQVLLLRPTGTIFEVRVPRHVHCGCTWADFMLA